MATVAGVEVKLLSAEDLFLLLALHAAKHVWEKLIWICDLARISQLPTLDWNVETGTDGQFRWENAPREEVWLNAFGNCFIGVQNHVVPATRSETVIKMARTLRVTGTVVKGSVHRSGAVLGFNIEDRTGGAAIPGTPGQLTDPSSPTAPDQADDGSKGGKSN